MSTIVIVGSGMMGSALAFPARENGNTVRLVGSPLDGEIIDACRATNRHPKFAKHFPEGIPPFPAGVEFYKIDEHTSLDEVNALELPPGSTVLFRRGGVWRG